MNKEIYPLTFRPVYKDYLWGGDRIIQEFKRPEPPGVYAESWELSDRPEGMSIVDEGPAAGRSLREIEAAWGERLLGQGADASRFPLLIKLIDSKDVLSVQVHPDDEAAARYGGEPKTEMWIILDADEGAYIYSGFKPGTTEETVRRALREGRMADYPVRVPVTKGDVVFTPGGRVHAVGPGCLILEVQQNSNTTYRLYDWDRVGPDGKPRELHIEEGLRVIHWDDHADPRVQPRTLGHLGENELAELLACPYFRVERLGVNESWPTAMDGRSFHALFVAEGGLRISWAGGQRELKRGVSVLVPAGLGHYTLEPDGAAAVLRVTVP